MGRTYGRGRVYQSGVFRGKRALLSLTTGGAEAAYRKGALHGDMAGMLRPIRRGMLQFIGFDVLEPHIVYGPVRLTADERNEALAAYARRLRTIGLEAPIEVGIY